MRISSITKNAGKACNNRLYRHIRTFEKIVKNYFVIYIKSVTLSLLQSAANAFDFGGPVLCDAHHYGEGHINDTFVVWREDHSKRFILQRINTDTFTNPVSYTHLTLPTKLEV